LNHFSCSVFRLRLASERAGSDCLGNDVSYGLASIISHRWSREDMWALLKKFNRFLILIVALTTLFNVIKSVTFPRSSFSHAAVPIRWRRGAAESSLSRRCVSYGEQRAEILSKREIIRAHIYICISNV